MDPIVVIFLVAVVALLAAVMVVYRRRNSPRGVDPSERRSATQAESDAHHRDIAGGSFGGSGG